jgi:hypothetical protein
MGFPSCPPVRARPPGPRGIVAVLVCAAILVVAWPAPARAEPAAGSQSGGSQPSGSQPGDAPAWGRPVGGRVVRGFAEPADQYAAGHRGVDFAAAPGTAVRAAGAGTVSFAGDVAGTLHVVVAHANGFRTSYSFLADVAVRVGDAVTRGQVLGHAGGSGPDHAPGVLHFGLRVGDRYVDPMQLFRPDDLTQLVRLVPAGSPPARPWVSPDRDGTELALGLALRPRPVGAAVGTPPGGGDGGGGCGDGIPLFGDAISAGCDAVGAVAGGIVDWTAASIGAALDEGLSLLEAAGEIGKQLADRLRDPLHGLLGTLATSVEAVQRGLLASPLGQAFADLVEAGRRFWAWTQKVCSKDAPAADGTGGDGHLLMAVGGIDSRTAANGSTFALDTKALGYAAGDVTWFSYAADGGTYRKDDTHGDLREKAAQLGRQLQQMARDHPGRPVDLIAHSQGGVVVDWFLVHVYKSDAARYPLLETVVTLSSPHQGAPLATAGKELRKTPLGRTLTDLADQVPGHPPLGSTAVAQLAEGSPFMRHLFDGGLPSTIHMTSTTSRRRVRTRSSSTSTDSAATTPPSRRIRRRCERSAPRSTTRRCRARHCWTECAARSSRSSFPVSPTTSASTAENC